METSLHRQLKQIYAGDAARLEVRLDGFRIDAIQGNELIEIQHGSLRAIRDKVQALLRKHTVRVVKPIIVRKTLVKCKRRGGREVLRRASPKRGTLLDVFHELIYFTQVFPHPRLTLEVPLVEIEEWRYPGHGRRRRRRSGDFQVDDQKLIAVQTVHTFHTGADLVAALGCSLPAPFHSGHLATALDIDRGHAQRIAYCFRHMAITTVAGKRGNAWLYELTPEHRWAA